MEEHKNLMHAVEPPVQQESGIAEDQNADNESTENAAAVNEARVEQEEDIRPIWFKHGRIFWPAKFVKVMGELTLIELFDEEKTRKPLENNKIKPFDVLNKIPAGRTKEWRVAYSQALALLSSNL